MPELPEVETIARSLREGKTRLPRPADPPPEQVRRIREARAAGELPEIETAPVVGKTVTGARVLWERTLAEPETAREFYERITGQRIEDIGRRGKYLTFDLNKDILLIHLRMSGDIRVTSVEEPLATHDRLTLTLDDRLRMAFNDTRKFGRVWLMRDPARLLDKLGPEPLDPGLNAERFHAMLAGRSRQIKPLLLDQSFIAGLGNIYTDEALHLSRIHPLTPSDALDERQARRLLDNIRHVLQLGIRENGASIDWVYRGGDFQNYFKAYGRTGEPCAQCGTPIQRIVVGQRGTHICPHCQPAP